MSNHDDYLNPDRHDPALRASSYKTEFSDTVIEPEVLETLFSMFFLDSSYHNDACPSFTYEFGDRSALQVFVDSDEPMYRDDPRGERFTVQHLSPDGDLLDQCFTTSDLSALREYLISAKCKGSAQ